MMKKIAFLGAILLVGGTLFVPFVASKTFEPLRFTLVDIVEDLTVNTTNITGNDTHFSHSEFNSCHAIGTIGNKAYCNNNITGMNETNCNVTGSCLSLAYMNFNNTGSMTIYNLTSGANVFDVTMAGGTGFYFREYAGVPGFFSKGASLYFASGSPFLGSYVLLNGNNAYMVANSILYLNAGGVSSMGNVFTVNLVNSGAMSTNSITSNSWTNVSIHSNQITNVREISLQNWTYQTSNRSLDTTYTNGGDRPLIVRVDVEVSWPPEAGHGYYITGETNSTEVRRRGENPLPFSADADETQLWEGIDFRVAPGETYSVNTTIFNSASVSLEHWLEDYT